MILQKTLLALLLSLQPHNEDISEDIVSRIERFNIIANSIVDASQEVVCKGNEDKDQQKYCWTGSVKELSIVLITKGWSETRFSKRIHNGKCYDNECDPNWTTYTYPKTGKSIKRVFSWRAKSSWQIHQQNFISNNEWKQIGFSTQYSTTLAATAAAKILAFGRNRCNGWNSEDAIERGMALYATGKSCKWSGTKNRMWLYKTLTSKSQNIDFLTEILTQNNVSVDLNNDETKFVTISQDVQL